MDILSYTLTVVEDTSVFCSQYDTSDIVSIALPNKLRRIELWE